MKHNFLSPAKLNLCLEIINKRKDGFHNIQSIVTAISLFDNITFHKNSELRFDSNVPDLKDNNSILETVKLIRTRYHIQTGLSIKLDKKIPLSSGLGGGSSNAAITLIALNEIWDLQLSINKLEELASMIGSDVPFFIRGGLSLIKGKGDIVKPINYQHPMWFVLIFSEYSLLNKTSRMYQILRECNFGNGTETQTLLRDINSNRCILDFRLFNTFNDISEKLFPNISKLIQKIEDTMELKFILSGSGPTLFCKMMTEVQARHVCSYLEENMNLQAIVVRSIRGIMK